MIEFLKDVTTDTAHQLYSFFRPVASLVLHLPSFLKFFKDTPMLTHAMSTKGISLGVNMLVQEYFYSW